MRAESFSSKQYPAYVHVSSVSLYPRKRFIRGAVTNGKTWIFLLMTFNDNYDGAGYQQSEPVRYGTVSSLNGEVEVPKPWPDLIAAILSHWVS